MKAALRRAVTVFTTFERWVTMLAALSMFAIMVIAAADVGMRYVFNAPFVWAHELISLYLVPILVYFAISATFAVNGHISVDLLQYRIPDRARHACYMVSSALVSVLFALLVVRAFHRSLDEYLAANVLAGVIAWPVWPSSAIVVLGSAMLCLRAGVNAVLHAVTLFSRREVVELPPLAVEDEMQLEPL